ncbi:MAG: CotH kinase family protein [Vicingaceae bacterium]
MLIKIIKLATTTALLLLGYTCFSQTLKINELSSLNSSYLDNEGEASDWIEIYNTGFSSVILSDYFLSDDINSPTKWQFPNVSLLPGEFFIAFASGNDAANPSHTNFSLGNSGETVLIFNTFGSILDSVSFSDLDANTSYGRSTDGTGNFVYFENPTPATTNNLVAGFNCKIGPPFISVLSGFYVDSVELNVTHNQTGVNYYYTTNGIEPTNSDSFTTGNITLYPDTSQNYYSLIPTNPSFNYPLGGYTTIRANNRGWLPPYNNVDKINIINVKAYKTGCLPSKAISRTFFIGEGSTPSYTIPVLSINTDSSNYFSDQTGIYVYGNNALGNYGGSGMAWERPTFIEYFDVNKQLIFSEKAGTRLNGHGSRHSTVKNLRIHARSIYGDSKINANIFSNSNINEFKHLLIRSGGHRPDCLPRDELATDMVSGLHFDAPLYQYTRTYINGEYWGIHALKEKLDGKYLSEKYSIAEDDIVILNFNSETDHGLASDSTHYQNMVTYAVDNDLNIPVHYNYIKTQMDVDNYIDYMAAQIFIGNADWTYSNTKFWRKRTAFNPSANANHDGRWRWLFYDLDGGFGGSCNNAYYGFNGLAQALSTSSTFDKYTKLFIELCEGQKFREKFILRASDLINSKFKEDVTQEKLNNITDILDPILLEHIQRWRYPSTSTTLADRQNEVPSLDQWNFLKGALHDFLSNKPDKSFEHMQNEFSLADAFQLTINVNDETQGYVQLNSIIINEFLEGVNNPVYPWNGIYFSDIEIPVLAIPKPGYQFVEWLGTGITNPDTSFVIQGDTLFTAIFEIDLNYVAPFEIVINEVQSKNNTTYADNNGEFNDWIELYNPNSTPVILNNYYLTDNRNQLTKFKIESADDISIDPLSWKIFWADGSPSEGADHTNFQISASGEFIGLIKPDGLTIADSINVPLLVDDESYGRNGDGSQFWVNFITPTPNSSNQSISIDEYRADLAFELYPNPIKEGYVYTSKKINATIYNVSGKKMFTVKNANYFNVNNLPKGIFIVVSEGGASKKFVKF